MENTGLKFAAAGMAAGAAMAGAPIAAGYILNKKSDKCGEDSKKESNIISVIGSALADSDSCEITLDGIGTEDFVFSCRKDGECFQGNCRDVFDCLAGRFGNYGAREIFGRCYEKTVTEKDLKELKKSGINCLRIPVRNFLVFRSDDIKKEDLVTDHIDAVISLCSAAGMKVILALYSAVGYDCDGSCTLFESGKKGKARQEAFLTLWSKLSEKYKENETVAAYDLLNSPDKIITDEAQISLYNELCLKAAKEIRASGDKHAIIIENAGIPADTDEMKKYGCAIGFGTDETGEDEIMAIKELIEKCTLLNLPVVCVRANASEGNQVYDLIRGSRISAVKRIYKGSNLSYCMYCKVREIIDLGKDSFDDINSKLASSMETASHVKF